MGERVVLCQKEDIADGAVRRFDGPSFRIALVRIADRFFAVDDRCSHEDYSLAEGEVWVDECEIECPQHGSTFDLATGNPCSLPATTPVATYEVVVDGDDISVILP